MTFVLIPGAGGEAWFWHPVAAGLRERGHQVVAVDLPADDPAAGLSEYVDTVVGAVQGLPELTLVALSLGGFTAPMVCDRLPVQNLVLLNAMIPNPGEAPNAWWDNTGQPAARRKSDLRNGRDPDAPFDVFTCFLHDLPDNLVAESAHHDREETEAAFRSACFMTEWPSVPTRVLAGTEDRFFPFEFQRRVAADRIGVAAEPVPGGHLAPLSHPGELVAALVD